MYTNIHTTRYALLMAGLLAAPMVGSAQDDKQGAKEEGNRNVMLNAASANGPREIQIGLPSADVNVLENGLPVTYATNPHSVNTTWRSDASLNHVGLLKISDMLLPVQEERDEAQVLVHDRVRRQGDALLQVESLRLYSKGGKADFKNVRIHKLAL